MKTSKISKELSVASNQTASYIVTNELIKLFSIKNADGLNVNMGKWTEKSQLKDDGVFNYETHISRAIADQKKAELLHNNPIFDFIPLSRDARANVFSLKELWKYWWKIDETDRKIYSVIEDAVDFGSGYLECGWKYEKRKVKIPSFDKELGKIKFVEKEIIQYAGVYSEFYAVEDVFHDAIKIEDSNIAVLRKFWDRDELIKAYELNAEYNVSDIPGYDAFLGGNEKIPQVFSKLEDRTVVVLKYYNKSADKFIVEANGKVIHQGAIPHLHKEIPVCKYDNHTYRNRVVQMGDYELIEKTERYLNAIREQSIDVTKTNIGFTIVRKDSDFNPEMTQAGPFNFIELENPEDVKHFSTNIQPSQLQNLEQLGQEDAIVLSGTDFRSQLLQSGETATKTASKNQSALKRINLILKKNSFSFYNRLAKLRLADIQLVSQFLEVDVPLKGMHYEGGEFSKLQDGYGIFTITPNMIKGKFDVVLQTESLLGDSTQKELEQLLNFFQVFGNAKDENGKNIINLKNAIEQTAQKMGVDIEILLQATAEALSGTDVLNSLKQQLGAMPNQNDPNYIPPEQRRQAPGGINVIGGGNTANQM